MPRATCVCTVQADPEMADATGLTPIIIAAQQGSMPLIKLLMEAGGARITGVDHHGLNLLGVAAELGGFDSITQQLLTYIQLPLYRSLTKPCAHPLAVRSKQLDHERPVTTHAFNNLICISMHARTHGHMHTRTHMQAILMLWNT